LEQIYSKNKKASAVAVFTTTSVVHSGVAIVGADLYHLVSRKDQGSVDIVLETSTGLSAIHHPSQAERATGIATFDAAVGKSSRSCASIPGVTLRIVRSLELSEFNELSWALYASKILDGGILTVSTTDFVIESVLTEVNEVVVIVLGVLVLWERRKLFASFSRGPASVLLAPSGVISRVLRPRVASTVVVDSNASVSLL